LQKSWRKSNARCENVFVKNWKSNPLVVLGVVVVSIFYIWCVWFIIDSVSRGIRAVQAEVKKGSFTQAYQQEDATGVEAARRPIVQTSKTLCEADVRKAQKAFRVRQYLEAYKNQGTHDQPWDADAKLFIRSWIDSNYEVNATNLPNVAELGDKLQADPSCRDPIVLTVAAATSVEYFERIHRFERAVAAFADSPYKAYPRFYATVELANNIFDEPTHVAPLDQSALRLFRESLSDGSILEEDQPDLAETFLTGWGRSFFKRHSDEICSIAGQSGPSFRWLTSLLKGMQEIDLAWKARGVGWANTVTASGWEGFHNHLADANADFTQAWKLHPNWPQAPAEMITVIMAESDAGQARIWFDRATAAEIDYSPAWHNMLWALRPRWEGSLQAMRDLGIAAIDSGRFDTDAPRQFFEAVWDIESDTNALPGQHIYGAPDIWPQMRRMYQGYLSSSSLPTGSRNGWRSSYATVAYFAHHYDVAREQLEQLDWQIPPAKLEGWGADLSLLPLEVAARTGSRKDEINQAEEQAANPDGLSEALGLYQKIFAENPDARTKEFVRHRLASLQAELKLQSGDWIDFLPKSTDDLNWIMARGKWSVLPGGQVEVQSGPNGSMLFSRVRVGDEFEITGDFDVVHSATQDFQAGLVMGLPESPESNHSSWYSFRIKRNANEGDIAAYSIGWIITRNRKQVKLNDHKNSFDFRFHKGRITASVNGEEIFRGAASPGVVQARDNQFLVGLGAYNDMNETVIRYSGVKLRRLVGGNALSER
jgi:hypothetical protein